MSNAATALEMQTLRLTLRPLSALGTPLAGDTLFGQLCWTLRHQLGNDRLNALLQGYTHGQPFAVVSDALPSGHVPLPSLPFGVWAKSSDPTDRKALKKKRWLPLAHAHHPLAQWQQRAVGDAELGRSTERAQPHNSINRQTGTTGTGPFAPYTVNQIWLATESLFDVWLVFDPQRIALAELRAAFEQIGQTGYGRDASIGLGKFELSGQPEPVARTAAGGSVPNAYLTLGPCAPQGLGFCPVRSHWQVTARFGRHGDVAVQSANPFKRPVLLAKAGSVFWPEQADPACTFIGQGLGGVAAPVSLAMPETVQQGYCPVLPVAVPTATATTTQTAEGAYA
jgi:CRISPR-associated protein Csm4